MTTLVAAKELLHKRTGSKRIIPGATPLEKSDLDSAKIEKIINKALAQLPSLTTVAVVEVATGACLAHWSCLRGLDAATLAVHSAEIVRQKQLLMAAMRMRGERLEDILIPLRKQLHLIRLARNGQWFVYLMVRPQDASLALAREVLKSIIA